MTCVRVAATAALWLGLPAGRTWTAGHTTAHPNPDAGTDIVRLRDGRLLLVYIHLSAGRHALHLALSADDSETWTEPVVLESGPGEYSYLPRPSTPCTG